ncbi:lysozyme [Streptomyces poonensis]|uniref:lysozyme n=1 Tax=Streptomyces poonensis TaxID=68255 RepID=A0A918P7W3_9ACTN|nr:lysozyme [Streptomyces poonensis]GGY88885.1 hydrolase [Streptomyces poonensis]GLJ92429.1 hydrolase [Streptomyces poonensis]
MPVRRFGTTRSRPALLLPAALAAVLVLLVPLPAAATATPGDPAPAPGSAHMGMGVLAHEGRSGASSPPAANTSSVQVEGVDVSSHQRNVAWQKLWNSGVRWAYVKATEGTSYKNPYYAQQYNGSSAVGMVRGAYHFAIPSSTSGAAQADYFVDNGGGWSSDGRTLPGVLDIEWNPYGAACYGKSRSAMVSWIRDFLNRYQARTGRHAVIYTATNWWIQCTGNHAGFGASHPLWIARYASSVGPLPAGWSSHTMWQYTATGPIVGDHNRFNGALDRLAAFANG